MNALMLNTERFELVAATEAMLQAELEDRTELARLLDAVVPGAWPPELLDEAAVRFTLEKLAIGSEQHGWWSWYVILNGTTLCSGSPRRVLVGTVGYKGPPSDDGVVEIGYSVLEEFRRRGVATEALAALVERAFERDVVRLVIGETLPELRSSIRVMEKCGFELVGEGSEEGATRYALTRERWNALTH